MGRHAAGPDGGLGDHGEAPAAAAAPGSMSHGQVMRAMSGILLGLFVAILSSTIVSNALPTILADLHGGESAYTWVITATLLTMTASMPIWGKLADLTSKKVLIQSALVIYVAGSVVAGMSQNPAMLIGARAVQGLGAGGLSALGQVILASMVSPRERGRYSGYFGAVFALGTVGGPLIGGAIVDTSWLGWRWCFYVGIPFAVVALTVLQKTLKLPVVRREVKVDYLGATLIAATVSLLLIWVSLAGHNYAWASWQTVAMLAGTAVLAALTLAVEKRAAQPVIPLHLFGFRTVRLATLASVFVGVAMYSATTFLSQYFQLAKGESPTKSGLMTLPMVLGLATSSMVSGRLISRFGKWKRFLVAGTALIAAGTALLATMRADTPYGLLAVYMALVGLGMGMTMQNLVLSVQNTVPAHELGAGSSVVSFFRTMGGAIGVSSLGALLASRVSGYLTHNFAAAHLPATAGDSNSIPDLNTLPANVRPLVTDAYGHGIGNVFLFAAPFVILAFLVVWFIRETALKTTSAMERLTLEDGDATAAAQTGAADARDDQTVGGDTVPVAASAGT